MGKKQPDMSNEYGVEPVDIKAGELFTIGLFSEIEGIGTEVITPKDVQGVSVVLWDRSTGTVSHSSLSLEHFIERLAELHELRSESQPQAQFSSRCFLLAFDRFNEILSVVEQTVFVPKNYTVVQ